MNFHPSRLTWACEDCERDSELWAYRGRCDGPPTEELGADEGTITAEASVGLDAAHLGSFSRCPIALVLSERPFLDRIFTAYSFLRRFGTQSDDDVPEGYLLTVDEEIRRIEALERDEARKKAEFERKTKARR